MDGSVRKTVGKVSKSKWKSTKIQDIMDSTPVYALPDEDVYAVMERMLISDTPLIPVVHPNDRKRIIGTISSSDIMEANIFPPSG